MEKYVLKFCEVFLETAVTLDDVLPYRTRFQISPMKRLSPEKFGNIINQKIRNAT